MEKLSSGELKLLNGQKNREWFSRKEIKMSKNARNGKKVEKF
jgi:hypothetical protein